MDFTKVLLHLFNVSVSASFLALAVVLFRLLFKKAPKWLTVSLWALVGIRLILPFSVESALSLIPSRELIPTEIMSVDPTKTHDTAFGLIDNPTYSDIFNSTVVVDDVDSFQLDVMFASYAWLVGVAVLLLYALASFLKLRHTVRVSVPYKDNVWLCDSVKSPFILGVFRPKIYLPSDMDEKTAELVLRHEKAHLKRKDHLWKPLGFVLLCVYWFNPVLWLSYVLLCRDIELACDERVIRDMESGDKKAYSEALLSCSMPQRMISACPVAFGEVGVKKRIKSVLNYKKPAFWIIVIAIIVSVAVALCFMTDPKEKSGENIAGVDEISELSFPMKEIVRGAHTYTIYDGISTTDNYFDAKIEDMAAHSEVYHFLDFLTLDELPDGEVNPMHEPQTNVVIKIQTNGHAPVSVIFHDNFSKMYMQKTTDFYSVRSKDYAVFDTQGARQFFEEKAYMNHLVWEYNLASSAWGNYAINIYVGEKYKINGEVTGEGNITRITDEEKGLEGISWSPLIVEKPGVYNIEIPVICDSEEKVFNLTISMVGKKALSTYYTLRADDLVIASYADGYSFELSEPETGDSALIEGVLFDSLDTGDLDVSLLADYNEMDYITIEKEGKSATVYPQVYNSIFDAFNKWTFFEFYSHLSKEELDAMSYNSITAHKGNEWVCMHFDRRYDTMWFTDSSGRYTNTYDVESADYIEAFFEEEQYTNKEWLWQYNPSASTYGYSHLKLIMAGDYESYTVNCENGSLMKTTEPDDSPVEITYSDPEKMIVCTNDDNLVWSPDAYDFESEKITVSLQISSSEKKSFVININKAIEDFDGVTYYNVFSEGACMRKLSLGVYEFDYQSVYWSYQPSAGATGWYLTNYIFPDGYEVKSAEASNGEIWIQERYYGEPDGEKQVVWSPALYEDNTSPAETDIVITAVKDGKEVEFKLKVTRVSGAEGIVLSTFKITPVNCKLTEQGWATFLLEEK